MDQNAERAADNITQAILEQVNALTVKLAKPLWSSIGLFEDSSAYQAITYSLVQNVLVEMLLTMVDVCQSKPWTCGDVLVVMNLEALIKRIGLKSIKDVAVVVVYAFQVFTTYPSLHGPSVMMRLDDRTFRLQAANGHICIWT